MWMHGKSAQTIRAYSKDVREFFRFTGCSLAQVRLEDVQAFSDSLDLAPSSKARRLAAVKSLLSFANKIGYIPFNAGAPVELPKPENKLSERILSESAVQSIIHAATSERDRALLRLLYGAGIRVSEAASLRWRHLQVHKDAGVVTVHGKGSKTRSIFLGAETWKALVSLGKNAPDDAPVFTSQMDGALSASQMYRIVRRTAELAGVKGNVSPHWMRHAHASHALDRGAPTHLVKETLGHSSLATTSRYTHARPGDSSARYLAS